MHWSHKKSAKHSIKIFPTLVACLPNLFQPPRCSLPTSLGLMPGILSPIIRQLTPFFSAAASLPFFPFNGGVLCSEAYAAQHFSSWEDQTVILISNGPEIIIILNGTKTLPMYFALPSLNPFGREDHHNASTEKS